MPKNNNKKSLALVETNIHRRTLQHGRFSYQVRIPTKHCARTIISLKANWSQGGLELARCIRDLSKSLPYEAKAEWATSICDRLENSGASEALRGEANKWRVDFINRLTNRQKAARKRKIKEIVETSAGRKESEAAGTDQGDNVNRTKQQKYSSIRKSAERKEAALRIQSRHHTSDSSKKKNELKLAVARAETCYSKLLEKSCTGNVRKEEYERDSPQLFQLKIAEHEKTMLQIRFQLRYAADLPELKKNQQRQNLEKAKAKARKYKSKLRKECFK